MIKIRKDYNGFADRFLHLLNGVTEDYTIDIVSHEELKLDICDTSNTPFACNTAYTIDDFVNIVVYNFDLIAKCNLSQSEVDACLLHEIGHYINKSQYSGYVLFNEPDKRDELEIKCDAIAIEAGLSLSMLTALCKMQEFLKIQNLEKRISAIQSRIRLYRPEWTCGRYNYEHHAAIFYNLIEGLAYSFEDEAADIIGEVLSAGRNEEIDIHNIISKYELKDFVIYGFFEYLCSFSLLTFGKPSKEGILQYRKDIANFKRSNSNAKAKTTLEKLPVEQSTAEMDYTDRVGGITSVMLELTYRCSEMCIHCYNPGATRNSNEVSGRADRKELCLDDYKRIIDELYDEGLMKICISGGDPFSKEIVWDIIDYIYHKGLAFDVYTNGQRIIDDVEKLANYYPRTVGVSIYSSKVKEHDYITRIPHSWEKSMAVVEQLSSFGIPFQLKCCVMRPNVKHYHEVWDIAKKYGGEAQFEICITDSVEGDICARDLRLPPELLEIVLRDDKVPLYVGKEAPNYGGQKKDMKRNGCGAAYNSFCITPEGDVIPCCAFHLVFGNLKRSSIREVLKSGELSRWQSLTLEQYEECGKHDYCDYCNLCVGTNYVEHGDATKASENNCYMAKNRHSLAMKMMTEGYDPLNGKSLSERLDEIDDYKPQLLKRKFRS